MRGTSVPRRGAHTRDQLHGSCAQQVANQQKQFAAISGHMHFPRVETEGTINACIAARHSDLLHRQRHHQKRLDGEFCLI